MTATPSPPPDRLTERQRTEAELHNRWAEDVDFREVDPDVVMAAPTALECRFILERMGPLEGRKILDLGCGYGEAAVYFAKQGAIVSACDISANCVSISRHLAERHQTGIDARVCTAENLPFPDESFDFVFANGVLHHVDIDPAMREVRRVLKISGQGFFIEPLPYNPLINAYRIIAHEVRTPHEKPLTRQDMAKIRKIFSETQSRGFWFFTLGVFLHFFFIERANPNRERYWKKVLYQAERYERLFSVLKTLDDAVLPRFPLLQDLCWNRVIQVRK